MMLKLYFLLQKLNFQDTNSENNFKYVFYKIQKLNIYMVKNATDRSHFSH